MCNDRICLGIIGTFSLVLSVSYLFLFSIPHASFMPASPAWQEFSLKMVVSGSNHKSWTPTDDRYLLLTGVCTGLGSLGFDRNVLFRSLYPHWGLILTGTSIFSLSYVTVSLLLLAYVIKLYRDKHKYLLLFPWIFVASILCIALLTFLGMALFYLNDSQRVMGEVMNNRSSRYWKAVSALIVATLLQYMALLIAIFHFFDDNDYYEYVEPTAMFYGGNFQDSTNMSYRRNVHDFRDTSRLSGSLGYYPVQHEQIQLQMPPTPPPHYSEAIRDSASSLTRLADKDFPAHSNMARASSFSRPRALDNSARLVSFRSQPNLQTNDRPNNVM